MLSDIGHAGDATVIHAIEVIPGDLRARLSAALSAKNSTQSIDIEYIVPDVIQASLNAFEKGLVADLESLFPGGLETIKKMSDDEIKAIINDGGVNHTKVIRCMRGTTVLIALLDPKKENIWVASLGDGQAGK